MRHPVDNTAFACVFKDGQVMFDTVCRSQKGSIKLAKEALDIPTWKRVKDMGVRCKEVGITVYE